MREASDRANSEEEQGGDQAGEADVSRVGEVRVELNLLLVYIHFQLAQKGRKSGACGSVRSRRVTTEECHSGRECAQEISSALIGHCRA